MIKPVVIYGLAVAAPSLLFGLALIFNGIEKLNLAIDEAFGGTAA